MLSLRKLPALPSICRNARPSWSLKRSEDTMRAPAAWVTPLAAVAVLLAVLAPDLARAADTRCSGHQLLQARRPEGSCRIVVPQIFEAPDGALRALVFPADVSLDATPDMESRIVIRSRAGDTLLSKDYASPRGANGYYVDRAAWSPDGAFFVFSLMSSGGHSPWSHPLALYAREQNRFVAFSDLIGGRPTLSAAFTFTGPHTLVASTWPREGDIEHQVPVAVDLEAALARLPPE
jgi:hypothetical protein